MWDVFEYHKDEKGPLVIDISHAYSLVNILFVINEEGSQWPLTSLRTYPFNMFSAGFLFLNPDPMKVSSTIQTELQRVGSPSSLLCQSELEINL